MIGALFLSSNKSSDGEMEFAMSAKSKLSNSEKSKSTDWFV